jgi:hypothetical protein
MPVAVACIVPVALIRPTGLERADAIHIRIRIEGADVQLEDASA